MACSDYKLTFFVDGAELPRPQRIHGCQGDKIRISATTSLPGHIEYRWSIDGLGPIVSTESYYDYTYDNKGHRVRLEVRTTDMPSCGIISDVKVIGKECTACPVICNTQTVKFPAGTVLSLIDENNKVYPIENCVVVCENSGNKDITVGIKRGLKAHSKCNLQGLRAFVYTNGEGQLCATLSITNSPIRFNYIVVGRSKYLFNTSKC